MSLQNTNFSITQVTVSSSTKFSISGKSKQKQYTQGITILDLGNLQTIFSFHFLTFLNFQNHGR